MPEKKNHRGRKDRVPGDETGPINAPELGDLLRLQREKKGLTQDQVAEITRLRKHIIQDLEDENWDHLPPPVFVKGFIRSYAKTLGLNEKDLLDRYHTLAPVETLAPAPLLGASKKGKKPIFWVILLLVLIGVVGYVWRESLFSYRLPVFSLEKIYPPKDRGVEKKNRPQNMENTGSDALSTGTKKKPEKAVEDALMKKAETARLFGVPKMEKPFEKATGSSTAALSEQDSSARFPDTSMTSPGFSVIEAASPNRGFRSPPAGTDSRAEEAAPPDSATASPDEERKPAIAETESPVADTEPSVAETASLPGDGLNLQGDVRRRTWLRICIDGQAPREYIFQPGSRPQWSAKEGFYVIIGNAAGIQFQFDGKEFGNLGNIGQVIRLKFPEEYDSSGCGE